MDPSLEHPSLQCLQVTAGQLGRHVQICGRRGQGAALGCSDEHFKAGQPIHDALGYVKGHGIRGPFLDLRRHP